MSSNPDSKSLTLYRRGGGQLVTYYPDRIGRIYDEALSATGEFVGATVGRLAHKLGYGPEAALRRITNILGKKSKLELLNDWSRLQGDVPGLEEDCIKLIKYAFPEEASLTQITAFGAIVGLVTQYPPVRCLFLQCKIFKETEDPHMKALDVWKRDTVEDEIKIKWTGFYQLASTSLSEDLAGILSSTPTEEWGIISATGLGVIDKLLAKISSEKLEASDCIAIRYLGTILEFPTFWKNEHYTLHQNTAISLIQKLCLCAAEIGVGATAEKGQTDMFFCDTEGIDTLAKATLCGIQNWLLFLSKAEISMSDWFDALQKFLELILRPESRDLLPKSWYEATKKLQEYSRDQWKYESHYSTNRKTADDLMDDGQEKSKDSTENLNNKEQDAIQEPSAHQANHIESFAKIVETKEITVKKAFFNPNPKEPETPYSTEAEEMILLKGLRTSALASGDDHSPLMKGTQQAILREAGTWLSDMTAPQIFWVRDTAGSGKSTVALHLAREWKIQARLAGRFFFGRALGETHTTRYFFTTIAQQGLSYLGPQVRSTICSGINRLGDPISATLEEQCMELFVKPLKATSQPVVVVMDALDECDSHDLTQLLNVMLPQLPNLPHLKLFLSSRPEDHIQRAIQIPYMQVSLSADEIHNFQDTDTFIRYSLRSVNLPPRAIERLTEKSEGNFIWAKIVCDLLVRMKGDHKSLLEDLLAHPLSMDQLYTHCLRISTSRDGENENIDAYKKVLGLIASASEPLSPRTIDELLNIDNSLDIVQDLQILLICRNYNEPVSLIHPTFHEFLLTSLSRW